ncbi:MAG TPA: 1,4-alpha-glucan branching protein GlgB [Candidatus Binataceae bacterium]|nr:1,4-alpha-glucan branching protein GlgB [Candidatus Binataceae bacterium]
MPRIAEAARFFYNWITDLADALQIEMKAASKPNHPNLDRKECHMAHGFQTPQDKSSNHQSRSTSHSAHTREQDDQRTQIDRLLALEHPDPHSLLGPHTFGAKTTVRAYRPDAVAIAVLLDDGARVPMTRVHEAGVFEVRLDRADTLSYRLEIQYPGGQSFTALDPYSFPPTIGDLDLHLWAETKHAHVYDKLGAHPGEVRGASGVSFAVWAPNARSVSVIGDFNRWDGRLHLMRALGGSGVWEIFVPDAGIGTKYKFEIRTRDGDLLLKADPFATQMEVPPATASVVSKSSYQFRDREWMEARSSRDILKTPVSIYEVHLASWRHLAEDNRSLTYRELASELGDYVVEMGFTHVELMPVMEYPFAGSWGYQVSGYFAPTSRFGTPDDFRYFVDEMHRRGIGVIIDWVPAHFPTDEFSLGRFDGTALFEHLDPRKGFHPEWNTYIFNYGRNEVRSFLIASALYWLGECHVDGLRVDAVASMIYLDYARREGEWVPNQYGGKENFEAIDFIRALNERAYGQNPGIVMVAEESTAWPAVSRPTTAGGLGFGLKWDMGWMHDTLEYFTLDPIHRKFHHRNLTFGMLYAWSENFVLPISHDEVVHGKRSLLSKMPGDRWQQFANLRSLYGYMWARCGKKLIFMGSEFGQWREWNHDESLDWHLAQYDEHRGLQRLVRDLNRLYRAEPALWEADVDPAGFRWIAPDNADDNVIIFMRVAPSSGRAVICVCNFSPVPRTAYRIGVPRAGFYREMLNTDSEYYGGGNMGNSGGVASQPIEWFGFPQSISATLPPLAVVWFEAPS